MEAVGASLTGNSSPRPIADIGLGSILEPCLNEISGRPQGKIRIVFKVGADRPAIFDAARMPPARDGTLILNER
jgi:hypothetical protein